MTWRDTCGAVDWDIAFTGRRWLCVAGFQWSLCTDDVCVGAEMHEEFGSKRLDKLDVAREHRPSTLVASRRKVLRSDPNDDVLSSVALQAGVSYVHVAR